ncbi:nucleotidyltransferase family protein [Alsobacter soli]|uniref:nucleotidyltransferase family protein n=1 Tax=Alsobacter soli TaxID=2109933 RepID=UPI001FE07154|nr:nucleotidyltransferase family protein [Alsobacter soli]
MTPTLDHIAAIVLAAGSSTRMGGPNKLLLEHQGKALVRHAAEAACQSGASPVVVVTGHQADMVEAALAGLDVQVVRNPNFAQGLSTSLKAGVTALPDSADGVVVALGDMPLVDYRLIRRMAAAFDAAPGCLAAVPLHEGEWHNPVVIARALFPAIEDLTGDAGAKKLLEKHRDQVIEVPVSDDAVALDVDTPEALARLGE